MQYYTAEIKKLLKNYRFYKMQMAGGISDIGIKDKIEFLENCINVLDVKDKRLITGFFFEEKNREELSNELFLNKATLYRRIDKILEKVAIIYKMRF